MVSSWRHLISLVPKWKTHPNPVMTHHIRERSRKRSTSPVRNGAGTLVSPHLMLKHKAVAYLPLPRKWSIIACSETPSGKYRIMQGPFINLFHKSIHWSPLHDTSPNRKSFENTPLYGNNKDIQKTPQYSKGLFRTDYNASFVWEWEICNSLVFQLKGRWCQGPCPISHMGCGAFSGAFSDVLGHDRLRYVFHFDTSEVKWCQEDTIAR